MRKPSPNSPNGKQKPLMTYMSDELVAAIDKWRLRQEGEPSRADAIRRMIRRVIKQDTETSLRRSGDK